MKVSLTLCLTNKALREEDICRSPYPDPCLLDLGTSWKSVANNLHLNCSNIILLGVVFRTETHFIIIAIPLLIHRWTF
jgi:hypothetical protein